MPRRLLDGPDCIWWHPYRQREGEPTVLTEMDTHGGETTADEALRGTLTSAGEKPQEKSELTVNLQCLAPNV